MVMVVTNIEMAAVVILMVGSDSNNDSRDGGNDDNIDGGDNTN